MPATVVLHSTCCDFRKPTTVCMCSNKFINTCIARGTAFATLLVLYANFKYAFSCAYLNHLGALLLGAYVRNQRMCNSVSLHVLFWSALSLIMQFNAMHTFVVAHHLLYACFAAAVLKPALLQISNKLCATVRRQHAAPCPWG